MRIGADYDGGACRFTVWAPTADSMELHLTAPEDRRIPMEPDRGGYWRTAVPDLLPGARYFFRPNGREDRPDPASQFQPEGVHGPSEVVDHGSFAWSDTRFLPRTFDEMVFYELHVGTFTPEGTFVAAVERLDDLAAAGVTAVEIMPVAQFPGDRNWGYDGTYLFAVQNSYGGPEGLRAFVDACHARGLSAFLDVVYNHFGPEGNYIGFFGPYFTDQYVTPWGSAVNFDDAYSDGVRNFYLENAIHWLSHYHLDGLRLDAIDQIKDTSARHILQEISGTVKEYSIRTGKPHYLVAESDLNDSRVLAVPEIGGHAIDAQWSDDFHHALHSVLTGEKHGYYQDFGTIGRLAQAYRRSFVYDGQYSPYRRRRHGNSVWEYPPYRFVVNLQNHDQIGNRARGDRITSLVGFESSKLALGALLLSPYTPFLFMGQEYGEPAPFQYFVSFEDPELIEAVRKGRANEFSEFSWQGEVPDPDSPETFMRSKLEWRLRNEGRHRTTLELTAELLRLRREHPALRSPSRRTQTVTEDETKKVIAIHRFHEHSHMLQLLNFADTPVSLTPPYFEGTWIRILCSAEERWGGPGNPPATTASHEKPLTLPPRSITLYEYGETG